MLSLPADPADDARMDCLRTPGVEARPAAREGRLAPLARRLGLAIWVASVCGTFLFLGRYGATSAERGPIARSWPADSDLDLDPTRANLLVFAHPRCPCTRATLENLAWEVTRWSQAPRTRVIFFVPGVHDPAEVAAFADTDLRRRALELPGFEVELDPDGQEAARFGARTSGEVLLYGPDGKLRFAGGVTPSRGHQGPNLAASALRATLSNPPPEPCFAPVFGCSLSALDPPATDASTSPRP